MISLNSWSIKPCTPFHSLIDKSRYECAYVGSELTLDERSVWINNYVDAVSNKIIPVYFNHELAKIFISGDQESVSIESIDKLISSTGKILLDATSLLLPELLYLMEGASLLGKSFDVIYVEPAEYSSVSYKPKIGIQSIDHSLSEDGPGINMLPRFATQINESHLVVALGYEGHRFGALLMSETIRPQSISGILGVPPFIMGWEKNSYAKNHNEMFEARKLFDADFKVVAANDPLQNYDAIKTIYKSRAAIHPKGRAKLHLAPIGTKPVALAMSWFAINHRGTGILYDFVKKKSNRSFGVGKIHIWEFSCE